MNPNKPDWGCWQRKANRGYLNSLPATRFKSERATSHKPAGSKINSGPAAGVPGREGAVVGGKFTAGDKARKLIFKHSDKEQMT